MYSSSSLHWNFIEMSSKLANLRWCFGDILFINSDVWRQLLFIFGIGWIFTDFVYLSQLILCCCSSCCLGVIDLHLIELSVVVYGRIISIFSEYLTMIFIHSSIPFCYEFYQNLDTCFIIPIAHWAYFSIFVFHFVTDRYFFAQIHDLLY